MEIMCAGPTPRGTEFVVIGNPGVRIFGGCGPRALASALTNSLGRTITAEQVYSDMARAGLLMAVLPSPQAGMSNSGEWHDAAANIYHASITAFRGYAEPWADWATFFNAHAGHSPMVVEVARNWTIRDELTGSAQNANTDPTSPAVSRYHIFTVFGRHDGGMSARAGRVLPPGYWVADGDNYAGGNDSAHGFNAADVLQFYSDVTMAAAQPCAALALQGQGSVTSMGVDLSQFFTADAAGEWYRDNRTGERVYKGCYDALATAGETGPVISGIKVLQGQPDPDAVRIVVGDVNTGTRVWIGHGAPDTWRVTYPGNALIDTEGALADANILIGQIKLQLAKAQATSAADPVVLRNAAIGAAMLDVLSLAANASTGGNK